MFKLKISLNFSYCWDNHIISNKKKSKFKKGITELKLRKECSKFFKIIIQDNKLMMPMGGKIMEKTKIKKL